jgi:RNA polymerase sigma-70 factor (ECF subfamily)
MTHTAALRRLARGLLKEPADAEDVVQQAWLVALQRRSNQPAGDSQGWLHGVVRKLSLQAMRTTSRRQRHEQAGARSIVPTEEPAAPEKLELLRQLIDAIDHLKDPYRTVILLRFVDHLPPREIARRKNVPVNTVRTWIRRGLTQLRGQLQPDPTAKPTWALFLVQLSEAPTGLSLLSVESLRSWASQTGTVLMESKIKASLIGAVVILLPASIWWLQAQDSTPSRAQSVGTTAALSTAPSSPPPPRAAAESAVLTADKIERKEVPSSTTTPNRNTWKVAGKVQCGDQDLDGIEVQISLFVGSTRDEPTRQREVLSDASGRFTAFFPPPDQTVTVTAQCFRSDFVCYGDDQLVPQGDVVEPLQLRLYPFDCLLEGLVQGDDRLPLADADVECLGHWVKTDEAGLFQLRASSYMEEVQVHARAEGYAHQRVTVSTPGAQKVARFEILLKPGSGLRGIVVDEEGAPVVRATISSFFGNALAETSHDGSFQLLSLDPNQQHNSLMVTKEGYVKEPVSFDLEQQELLTVTLQRGVRLQGIVLDANSRGVDGASLYIGFSPSAWNRINAVSAADGSFCFPNVPSGSQTLGVQRAGMAPVLQTLEIPSDTELLAGIRVVLQPGRYLAGTVQDPQGNPRTRVGVSARQNGDYIGRRTATDEHGRFRLEGLPAEGVALEFFGTDLVRKSEAMPVMDREDLLITVLPASRVTGRVIDGNTGLPIQDFTVRLERVAADNGAEGESFHPWMGEGSRFTDAEGIFLTSQGELRPDQSVGIVVQAKGYGPAWRTVQVTLQPRLDDLVIELFAGSAVRGVVLQANGVAPARGAQVRPFAEDAWQLRFPHEPFGTAVAICDERGFFDLQDLPPGPHLLLVEIPDLPAFLHGPLEVPTVGSAPAQRVLPPQGSLQGRLLDEQGVALAAATVVVWPHSEERRSLFGTQERTTASDGSFQFDSLADGAYQVAYRVAEQGTQVLAISTVVWVEDGQETHLTLQPPGGARVHGLVRCPISLPETLHVRFTSEDREVDFVTVAVDGRFACEGLLAGSYVARAWYRANGNKTRYTCSHPFELRRGENLELTLDLEPLPRR